MKVLSVLFISILTITSFAQQYKPVDDKSEVNFTIKNFGFNVGGSLKGLKGDIKFDPSNLSSSAFNVSVDANTINTGNDTRDNHLRKEEYFDVANHPAITFTSTGITGSQNAYTISGVLTIKGVAKKISFPFAVKNENSGATFSGSFTINRKDFGVGGSSAVLGNDVNVSLKVFALKS